MKHNCSCCNQTYKPFYYNDGTAQQLLARKLCFDCNYWWKFLYDEVKEEHYHHHSTAVVIKGEVFTDGGTVPKGYKGMTGHGGREFTICMLDGSKEWTTNNLWAGGAVPDLWRDKIVDNAEFVRPLGQPVKEIE